VAGWLGLERVPTRHALFCWEGEGGDAGRTLDPLMHYYML